VALATFDACVAARAHFLDDRALAQAYLYQGVAHLRLAQPEAAKASFKLARQYDPTLQLSPPEFPPSVIRAFKAAQEKSQAGFCVAGPVGAVGLVARGAAPVAAALTPTPTPTPPPGTSFGSARASLPQNDATINCTVDLFPTVSVTNTTSSTLVIYAIDGTWSVIPGGTSV